MEAGARRHRRSNAFIVQSDTPPPFLLKEMIVKPISASDANRIIKALHYSGKVVPNSQLHFGVFFGSRCGGAIQFGPSMRKDLIAPLVRDTGWNEFIELNRIALADWIPRNGESRCIGYVLRYIKKNYTQIKWVISFADGTQCGDGTIYRATGFVLTGIKKNTQLAINPITKEVQHKISAYHQGNEYAHSKWRKLVGYQFRYIYFIDPTAREKLTVPVIPYSEIERRGAKMYLGKRPVSEKVSRPANQPGDRGSTPTAGLND